VKHILMTNFNTRHNMALSMDDAISGVEAIIGYNFTTLSLLWEALQAPGSGVFQAGDRQLSNEGNRRMAMLGDTLLQLVIQQDWWIENVPRGRNHCVPISASHLLIVLTQS
jgi:hypothetical protein